MAVLRGNGKERRHNPFFSVIHFGMDWQLIVPGETGWAGAQVENAREVRLRPGQGAAVIGPGGVWRGSYILTPGDVTRAAQALCGHELAARREELNAGFVPLPGGHRLGVCGVRGPRGVGEITSLCVRVAHEVKGAGEGTYARVRGKNALVIGPPGSGKTTLLRDLARLYALDGFQVGIADCRGEIAACWDGRPQLDVGPSADVVTGMEKAEAVMLLIRSMSPQVIVADEIGGERDVDALMEAMGCGVTVLASAHGRNMEDLRKRPGLHKLLGQSAFEEWVFLDGPGRKPKMAVET